MMYKYSVCAENIVLFWVTFVVIVRTIVMLWIYNHIKYNFTHFMIWHVISKIKWHVVQELTWTHLCVTLMDMLCIPWTGYVLTWTCHELTKCWTCYELTKCYEITWTCASTIQIYLGLHGCSVCWITWS